MRPRRKTMNTTENDTSNTAVILSRSVRHVLLRLYDEAQRATTWHNVPQRGHCEASAWRQRGITPHNVGVIKGVKCHKTWRPIRDTMTTALGHTLYHQLIGLLKKSYIFLCFLII